MQKSILIIDDDAKLNQLLTGYLAGFGFSVFSATHPEDGLKQLVSLQPDLVILDVMLPGMDGFEVCKTIRKTSAVPVIMLTARGDVMDRIVGLEIGADDYLPKPFEPRELVARIQTVLRRQPELQVGEILKSGPIEADIVRREARLAGEFLDLTTAEFDLLVLLMKQPGKVFSRDDLLENLRGFEWDATNRTMDILVSRLRTKLFDDPKSPTWIRTVWGTGYQFIPAKET
ncbi:MAG: response regulator transcription factor [Bacteroidetes bacterium]|nr:response regulator transcription factor [Bacteroidota bacterium]